MTVRFSNSKIAKDVQPNDTFEIFNENVRVRYITYLNGRCTFYLQPESEPLSPFVQNDTIIITVPENIQIDVFVN